ncbi:hypothetical protein N7472_004222 [Penicillium cf. griseofulvum]|uniref:Uncharacterized protein n=1 Tax=Penicillium cf. griseofulvum TaxID=2972120 RepID=A0A9W9JLA2_9EURO|nr:hypothetical protein N7472_004222 [Penicillium cf. griseofulvum]KAJ5443313.1 hypothetical protein N7445_004426 [Penicillium cf. griseofulvum]
MATSPAVVHAIVRVLGGDDTVPVVFDYERPIASTCADQESLGIEITIPASPSPWPSSFSWSPPPQFITAFSTSNYHPHLQQLSYFYYSPQVSEDAEGMKSEGALILLRSQLLALFH